MKVIATVFWIYLVTTTTGQKSCEEWKKFEEYCYMVFRQILAKHSTLEFWQNSRDLAPIARFLMLRRTVLIRVAISLRSVRKESFCTLQVSVLQDTTPVKAWVGLRRRYNQWKWTDGTWLDTTEFTDNYLDKWAEQGNCVYVSANPSSDPDIDDSLWFFR
ncbi:hypothetical protein ANCDUO_04879 [Ancylostoma duodenale]|uniref:C-type lectin domain-containing protein n=1 Tax=Ancylostoma duodenale TaxID=51022 RepID=A0A0C2GZZ7_9BILA|nr:hypothetical protein ANCDUO_04879 [Ancylostoma duodenale]